MYRSKENTCTNQDWKLPMRLRERIGSAQFWVDDEGPMDSGSEPGAVCMPPKCALLAFYGEAVGVGLTGSDRALSHELRPVSPCGSRLPDSMPVSTDEVWGIRN
jgi:hypothetical protein